ncbi:MAG: hypothetical protein A2622_12215 [Bdellovibrionales bacterium RIFCSPHIGHO2_01_FULL_40_29]|nr:MAG: hypothetical protein A2622_12215 [Bdellovibrionales bacterium RIFCSPHIGHO2_01_FULL_40_29]OFZ32953.1 MAG: hypothetical protein A3D17_09520 [Bdellovibrionales bacterium RIFCSPHIGHO2_02_FULL_40_15]
MTQGTLLIVEDEFDLLEILVEMLSPVCGKILTTSNGKEALDVLSGTEKIHAVLSDINMPLMTGFQLLAQVRESGSIIPFVTLTAYADQENMRESIRLNATDFLTKPFDRKELADVIGKALRQGINLDEIQQEMQTRAQDLKITSEFLEYYQTYQKKIMGIRIENSKYIKQRS